SYRALRGLTDGGVPTTAGIAMNGTVDRRVGLPIPNEINQSGPQYRLCCSLFEVDIGNIVESSSEGRENSIAHRTCQLRRRNEPCLSAAGTKKSSGFEDLLGEMSGLMVIGTDPGSGAEGSPLDDESLNGRIRSDLAQHSRHAGHHRTVGLYETDEAFTADAQN